MNLVRAISLGGGGRDLRGGNDSTRLICHVQLFIIALDCIFNIVVDNFLRDPLTVLIIFICQVFLLIIGLIFYLMASANQAMKEGMHEKVMRYHQLTTVLWTLYFSMLIWWYIWVLKRSWPSAGDHFSFTFSGSNDMSNQTHSSSTYSPPLTTTTTTTTTSSTEIPLTFSPTGEEELKDLTTMIPSTSFNQSTTNSTQSDKNGNGTISFFFPFRFFSIMNKTKGVVPLSAPVSGHSDLEDFTFFWTPGFIAVYTIERTLSLFFYVAFILGTLHIVNTSLIVEDESAQRAKHKINDGTRNSKQTVKNRIRSSLYGSSKNPTGSPTNSHKSGFIDDDNGDSFIRQLEYDGDPFQNAQYEYQYKNNNYEPSMTSFNYGSHYHPHAAAPFGDLGNDHPITSDGDEENASEKSSETEMNRKRRLNEGGGKRESRNRQSDLTKSSKNLFSSSLSNYPSLTSHFKPSKNKDKKMEKTKGGLRNIMMMAELENSNVADTQEPFSTNNDNDRKSASIVSTSVDSMTASGSTDKLLVSELFMSSSNKNDNIYQSQNEAFHTDRYEHGEDFHGGHAKNYK